MIGMDAGKGGENINEAEIKPVRCNSGFSINDELRKSKQSKPRKKYEKQIIES